MLESKHKSIKTLKQIHIPTYIREGGVVKGYARLQNVKIPELDKLKEKISFRSIDELVNHVKNLNYNDILNDNGKVDYEKFQKEILGLYSDGMHGIQDQLFTRRKDALLEAYDEFGKAVEPFSEDMNHKWVWENLTDSDTLEKLHKINNTFEDKFNKEFGLETERVNQFVFRTKLNLPDNENIVTNDMLRYLKISDTLEGFGLPYDPDAQIGTIEAMSKIGALISDTDIPQQKLGKTLIPALLLMAISEEFQKHRSKKEMYKIDVQFHQFMKGNYGLPSDLRNYNSVLKDPDNDVKKPLLKQLNELGKDGGLNKQIDYRYKDENVAKNNHEFMVNCAKELSSYFKKVKPDEIIPTFIEMMETGQINKKYNENSDFKKQFNHFVSSTTNYLFDAQNSKHGYVYISNNPMDFITMSPHGNITSCQSISEFGGAINVNQYNINVVNSINLTNSHDFMMYTLDGNPTRKNIKSNRISLHYNDIDKKFYSYEENRVYYKDRPTNYLSSFIDKNNSIKDNIKLNDFYLQDEMENSFNDMAKPVLDIYRKLNKKSNDVYRQIKDTLTTKKVKDFDSENDIFKHEEKMKNLFDEEIGERTNIRNDYIHQTNSLSTNLHEYGTKYLDNIISNAGKMKHSMLYGSPVYEAMIGMTGEYSDLDSVIGSSMGKTTSIIEDHLYDIEYNRDIAYASIKEQRKNMIKAFRKKYGS